MEWSTFIPEIMKIIVGGGLITWFFNYRAQRRDHDKMQKDLFKEFNDRYDKLNDLLYEIKNQGENLEAIRSLAKEGEQGEKYIKALNDYLNLCAEEFFWYRKRRIDKKVWISWQAGMKYWYNELTALREMWQEELNEQFNSRSYYLDPGEDFFHLVDEKEML